MKSVWSELTQELEEQKQLTRDLILKMTQEKSSSRLGRIIKAESLGVLITGVFMIYLAFNFSRLEHWTGIAGGIGLFIILALGINFGIRIIMQAKGIDLLNNSYSEVIRRFEDFKKLLRAYKKLSIWTSGLSALFVMPVMTELFLDKNLLEIEGFIKVLGVTLLLVPLVLYAVTRFYKSNVSAVSKALKDVDFKE